MNFSSCPRSSDSPARIPGFGFPGFGNFLHSQQNRRQLAAMSMQSKSISIADYRYELPPSSIAFYPLAERDASKLLIYRGGSITEDIYRNIADHLPPGTLLVFNNTKVVEARIVFQKPTGGQIEIFCLEPPAEYGGMAAALAQRGRVRWKCLIGGASKWKPGQVLVKTLGGGAPGEAGSAGGRPRSAAEPEDGAPDDPHHISLEARWIGRSGDAFIIELSWTPAELSFAELLHQAGLIPLPPYIHRTVETTDSERYQTVYARHEGSVAAPTAGLHFTAAIFASLAERDIRHSYVTLHVGAGTFLPVKAATMGEHHMHIEFMVVQEKTIVAVLETVRSGRPVIAVGTTSARTLESLYWLGRKVLACPDLAPEDLAVQQWEAYAEAPASGADNTRAAAATDTGPTTAQALTALLAWMERRGAHELVTTTQLLITPGYTWRVVAGLVTNFHQPESTLLLLVASLIGKDWRALYGYALEHGFRFLSYGDGCLLLPGSNA
jgi:S-adenosylmethionine:tRNA ribosyltransferase-isomerase